MRTAAKLMVECLVTEGGAGRMGAAHIDLPVDIAKMQVSGLEMPLMKDVVCQQEAEESQTVRDRHGCRTALKYVQHKKEGILV